MWGISQLLQRHRAAHSWLVFVLLSSLALALRWYRLDLTSFRFDAAEAMFRARETFALGHPPLTGIENSLGFRNPGGFIWTILPTALFSPRVELTTAWIGLLAATGLWPLYRLGRQLLPGWAWLVPCTAYAFMPGNVFLGRTVWAQNLMPAFGAWALWCLFLARNPAVPAKHRGHAATAVFGLLSFATAVHLSGAAYLIAAFFLLARPAMRGALPRRSLAAAAAVLGAGALLLVPSLLDWRDSRLSPRPKAQHAVVFEAAMPPPPPPGERAWSSVSSTVELLSSPGFAGGLDEITARSFRVAATRGDLLLLALVFVGFGRLLLNAKQRAPSDVHDYRPADAALVLVTWLAVPAALGAVFMTWLNATYFAPSLAALVLLAGFAVAPARAPGRWRRLSGWLPGLTALLLFVLHVPFFLAAITAAGRHAVVNGQYYIPLRLQEKVAEELRNAGVRQEHFVHMSGEWYERPYEYLHEEVAGAAPPQRIRFTPLDRQSPSGEPYALVDDVLLRADEPARAEWLKANLPNKVGTVRYRVYPDFIAAGQARDAYFALPR